MADNFNFRQYLYENKLGAYSKVKPLNEATVEVHPGSEGSATKNVTLTVTEDPANEYELEVLAVDGDEAQIRSGKDSVGRELNPEELRELELEYSAQIADAIEQMYGADARAMKKAMGIKEKKHGVDENDYFHRRGMEQLSPQTIDRIEGLINSRMMSEVLQSLSSIIDDLEAEGFDREDVQNYLKMELKDFLG